MAKYMTKNVAVAYPRRLVIENATDTWSVSWLWLIRNEAKSVPYLSLSWRSMSECNLEEAASAGELAPLVAQPGAQSVHFSGGAALCKGFPRPTSTLNLLTRRHHFQRARVWIVKRATVPFSIIYWQLSITHSVRETRIVSLDLVFHLVHIQLLRHGITLNICIQPLSNILFYIPYLSF